MSRYQAYPEYKDSGVEWVGRIPESWTIKPLKFSAIIKNGQDYKSVEVEESENSYPVIGSGGKFSNASRYLFNGESVLLGRKGTIDKPLYFNGPFWTVDTMFYTELGQNVVPKFIYYCATTVPFDFYATSTALPSMTQEGLGNHLLAVPSYEEQARIANFLDRETAKIDTLIEKQQKLIQLLQEKRQVVISHAVTKGLDPNVKMKDSGVEWLGEVPEHWKVSKLGHYIKILTGFPFSSSSFSHDESDIRLLRGVNIGVGSLKWRDTVYWRLDENDVLSSYLMEEGQIVLGMDRPWIGEGMRIARVKREDMPCLLLQRVAAITPSDDLEYEYLFFLLASELFKAYAEPDLTGVSVPHISPEQISNFRISLPNIKEQRRISSFIKKQLNRISVLFEKANESIELLQERRTALISAAVTGKIDVRNAA